MPQQAEPLAPWPPPPGFVGLVDIITTAREEERIFIRSLALDKDQGAYWWPFTWGFDAEDDPEVMIREEWPITAWASVE